MTSVSNSTSRRLSVWVVLAQNVKTIVLMIVLGAVILVGYSLTLPKKFSASSTVLPPERQGMGGMLASFLSNSPIFEMLKGEGTQNPTTDLFKTVIDSRSVSEEVARDPVINAYLARTVHRAGGLADTTIKWMGETVRGAMMSEGLRTGQFIVTVTLATPRFPSAKELDSTRIMSAYITNKYVEALDRFNRDRLLTSAKGTRIFIEGEYDKRMVQLDSSYRRLQAFQQEHQAIALPEQLAATVGAAAKLTGEIQKIETALRVEERELGPSAPTVKTLNAELEEAKNQLQKYDDGGAGEYILALKSAPELTRELAGLMRETKVLEQISAYLRSELEQQRIAEQRDLPSLQTLDGAVAPTAPTGMGRTTFAIIGVLLGLIVGTLFVLIRQFVRDVRTRPEAHYRLINLIRTIQKGEHAVLLAPLDPQTTDDASAAAVIITPIASGARSNA